jgi:hypothetical protein
VVIAKEPLLLVTFLKTNFCYITLKSTGKVKLSLCLIKHHAMKTCGGLDVQLHAFLTSTLDEACEFQAPTDLSSQKESQVHIALEVGVINSVYGCNE